MTCEHPGCTGTVGEHGYCDTCLREPPTARRRAVSQPPTDRYVAGTEPTEANVPSAGPTGADPTRENGTRAGTTRRDPGQGPVPSLSAPLDTGPWWGLELISAPVAREAPGPEDALIPDPRVPAERWRCRTCRAPVGTSHHGQAPLSHGRCPMCGTPYSPEKYAARLAPGDLVDGRYKVLGCVGQGGVGWVYAARDDHLDDRWVALKGLVDSADPDSRDAVKAEKHFLLSIEHERIVRIHDSVFHEHGGRLDLYLVMEFIEGYPLSDSRFLSHSLEEVLGTVLQILQAMDYLHRHGYLFCDLKPSNVMMSPSGAKLIDLGAVNSNWSTLEFAAPELREAGPSVATDLHTAGRTLQVLTEPFGTPPEPLRGLIACATHPDPAHRFSSAAAFADQLSGVLSELLAVAGGPARQVPSRLFAPGAEALDGGLGVAPPLSWWTSAEAQAAAEAGGCRPLPVELPPRGRAAARLPEPHPDPRDPAAGFLGTQMSSDARTAATQLDAYGRPSEEVLLRRCRVRVSLGDLDAARSALGSLPPPRDRWRRAWQERWHLGLIALADGAFAEASDRFAACSALLPGEAAPRFARALCEEYRERRAEAERLYRAVWAADEAFEGALFGLARVLLRSGDRAAAVAALDEIPETSPYRHAARLAAIRALAGRLPRQSADGADGGADGGLPAPGDLAEAEQRLATATLSEPDRTRLRASVLEAALALSESGQELRASGPFADGGVLTGGNGEIREKLEETYRELCLHTAGADDKTILTDLANRVRPLTFW